MAADSDADETGFVPDYDLGEFRYAVARYVKLLIRARLKAAPTFLPHDQLARWKLENFGQDKQPVAQLLAEAAAALGDLNERFLPRCPSGGVLPGLDDSTPHGRLVESISFLTPTWGGGPFHNAALLQAAADLRDGGTIDWDRLVEWDKLPDIRDDLDALPEPDTDAKRRTKAHWSEERTPSAWAKVFGIHRDTFVKRVHDGIIVAQKISDRSYRVRVDQLPPKKV